MYNSSDTISEKSQYGETTLIIMNMLAHRYMGNGVHETKLGQWAWIRYREKEGKVFHVVSVYRTCILGKYNSAYLQQMQYLLKHNDVRCPREVILEDLAEHIREYKEKGDSMVVMGDWNENVRGDTMLYFKERTGLIDVVLEQFEKEENAPATYNRGKTLFIQY